MIPLIPSACDDCNRLTSGRCWRHSTTTIPIGFVQVIPSITIKPTVEPSPYTYPETAPR